MLMHFRIKHFDRYVGVFVLLALIGLILTLVFMARGQKWIETRHRYAAVFNKVPGLKPGTPVTMSGMEIGSVKSFRLNPLGKVEVNLEVLDSFKPYLRRDSMVTIVSTLLGGKTVEITMGSPNQPVLAEGEVIPSQEPKELTDLFHEIDVQTPLKKVDEALENLKSLTAKLNSPEGELFSTLRNIQIITTRLKEGEGSAGAILRDQRLYREITAAAESAHRSAAHVEGITEKAAEIAGELPAMVQQVNGRIQDIQGILGEIKEATTELSPILKDVKRATAEAPVIAGNIKDITHDVREITGDVKKVTPELPEFLHQTQQAVEDADKIISGLQNHWLIRGAIPPPSEDAPIAISQRQNPYEKKGDVPR
jgi:phospholipid/cholesterol/gamma-HCH transport system substrate-binding protein